MVVESLGVDMKRCEIYSQKTLFFYYFSTAEIKTFFNSVCRMEFNFPLFFLLTISKRNKFSLSS